MGNSARRLRLFLSNHPLCCYCGGQTPATTQDHFPSRSFFPGRLWPEGYVFPACTSCNSMTAEDEAIVALLARIYPEASSPEEKEEVTRLMRALSELHPELFASLFPSASSVRRWLRKRGVQLPHGMTTKDVPIISIEHPRIGAAVDRVATKLFCSLYYMHTGSIIPHEGGIVFRWFTNAQSPEELSSFGVLAPLLTSFPKLQRQGTTLGSAFNYRYGIASDTGRAGVFQVTFKETLVMIGFAFDNVGSIQIPRSAELLRPFSRE